MKQSKLRELHWNQTKLRGLNWNGQNLKDWIELWPNLKGVIWNLAIKKINRIINRILFFFFKMETIALLNNWMRVHMWNNINRTVFQPHLSKVWGQNLYRIAALLHLDLTKENWQKGKHWWADKVSSARFPIDARQVASTFNMDLCNPLQLQ